MKDRYTSVLLPEALGLDGGFVLFESHQIVHLIRLVRPIPTIDNLGLTSEGSDSLILQSQPVLYRVNQRFKAKSYSVPSFSADLLSKPG